MKNVVIRYAREADIPSIVDIQIDGWKTAYKGIVDDIVLNSMNRDKRIEKIKNHFSETSFIVAEFNKELVGFCNYIDSNKFTPDMPDIDCELSAMYVKPIVKYNGIGTKMFQFVISEFKRKNKTKMILWCLKDNAPSKMFYKKMGGEIINERIIEIGTKHYYEVGFRYNLMNT